METLLEGNRVLKEAQQFADTAVIVRPLDFEKVCFASFGDASFSSAKQLAAQQGLFIMACTPSLAKNETAEFSPVVRHSKQIERVVRSTLSAEAYSMSSSLDKLTWIRCMWGYVKNPNFARHKPETSLRDELPGLTITDCKSLFDLLVVTKKCSAKLLPRVAHHDRSNAVKRTVERSYHLQMGIYSHSASRLPYKADGCDVPSNRFAAWQVPHIWWRLDS